jgi:hypothetical protein
MREISIYGRNIAKTYGGKFAGEYREDARAQAHGLTVNEADLDHNGNT